MRRSEALGRGQSNRALGRVGEITMSFIGPAIHTSPGRVAELEVVTLMHTRLPEHLKIAQREGLTSVMNSTRWHELFSALEAVRVQLDFRRKDLRIDGEPPWDGDIYHVFGLDQFIEWMEIRPRIAAALDETIDAIGIPYEKINDTIRVYGYRRTSIA